MDSLLLLLIIGVPMGLLLYYRTCRCCDKLGMSFFHLRRGKLRYNPRGEVVAFYCDDCLKNHNEFMKHNAKEMMGLIWK